MSNPSSEPRACAACGAPLEQEPDLRVQSRQSQRDATGKVHLQHAAVLGVQMPRLWYLEPVPTLGGSSTGARE